MYKEFFIITILIFIIALPVYAQTGAGEGQHDLDLRALEDTVKEFENNWTDFIPDFQWRNLFARAKSGQGIDWRAAINGLLKYFFHEVVLGSKLLGQLLVMVVFAALLTALEQSFKNQETVQIAQTLVFVAIMGIAIQSFNVALRTGRTAVGNMVSFMQALLPVLFTMLVASGSVASTALMHPFLLATITILGALTRDVIFPLLYLSTVLHLVTYVVPQINVGRLAKFIAGICVTFLGLALCVFVGISTIQGAAGKVVDGVAMRSTKFVAASFIPVVGKLFADAVEAVIGYSAAVQTAVSGVGLAVLLMICSFPLIKILALIFVYKLAAALAEPIADSKVARCLGGLGNSLGLIFATVGVVALLFFLAITALVGLVGLPLGRG
ncbi:MAG: stage III sporulation protein AE [Firmicutes bacterium]|nr:stage III sporulation protein AE [Bacillota bacterium]